MNAGLNRRQGKERSRRKGYAAWKRTSMMVRKRQKNGFERMQSQMKRKNFDAAKCTGSTDVLDGQMMKLVRSWRKTHGLGEK